MKRNTFCIQTTTKKLFLWYLLLMWYMKNSLQKYIPWNGKRVKPNSNKTSHKMDKTLKGIKIINSLLFSHEISRRWCIFTIKCAQKKRALFLRTSWYVPYDLAKYSFMYLSWVPTHIFDLNFSFCYYMGKIRLSL